MSEGTYEDAKKAQIQALQDPDNVPHDPAMPLPTWLAKRKLKYYQQEFESGAKYAMMEAIYVCAQHSLSLPDWLAEEFMDAFLEINHFRQRSWDNVLPLPFKPNQKISALRDKMEKAEGVYMRCLELKEAGYPIDASLFERAGYDFGISKTTAEKYYRELQKEYNYPPKNF